MVAALAVTLVGATGLVLDAGLFYVGNQELKAATEAAALTAAIDTSSKETAEGRARQYLNDNGFRDVELLPVQTGRYCADSAKNADRFIDADAKCRDEDDSVVRQANAVRLTTRKKSKRFLTSMFSSLDPMLELTATATAARIDEAGIATTANFLGADSTKPVGALLDSVNSYLLNPLLGINLTNESAVRAMMTHNVDAALFFDHLAKHAANATFERRDSNPTYGALLERENITLGMLLLSASEATNDKDTADTLRSLSTAPKSGNVVNLKGLFGLGVWQNMPVGEGSAPQGLRAGLNAYQLLAYAAQASPATLDLSAPVNLVIPGSVVKIESIGTTSPSDASKPRFSFGPEGTEVSTSSIRLKLTVGLGSIPLVDNLLPSLPLMIDIGTGSAKIQRIQCGQNQMDDTTVDVLMKAGLLGIYLGDAPANAMDKPLPEILPERDIRPAKIVNGTKLLNITLTPAITARALVGPVTSSETPITFSSPRGEGKPRIGIPGSTIQANYDGAPAELTNSIRPGATVSNLLSDLKLYVCDADGNNCLLELGALTRPLAVALDPILRNVLDGLIGSVLDNLLAALGLQLGNSRVWVTGVRCGVPVLV
ncbi:TadG family pilus assembly protein [Sphingobium sp. YBL2]|uniref:TadG family pilus assembly protein n=1 Tax=Sphingobium sp. (strain YBL2) TaxID=484429 RepID=UPI00155DBE68|nr:TadG family pilus assembly protein [Sphingobium sp. YBL2]